MMKLITLFLIAIVYNHCVHDKDVTKKLLLTFLLAYVIPVFSFFIMPDTGLILSLNILLWVADKVVCAGHLTWKNVGELGLGLGIELLSKYHILLLG
ncbi:MAG: hypothetical protein KBD30_07330 [Legionellaceae bacterium]|nr:hypothetical protein [Legionellaceae bacterium]